MEAVKEKSLKRRRIIDVRAAAQAAGAYFQDLYPNVTSFSLEEVELSEDGNYWQITLSFEISQKSGMLVSLPFQPPRTKFKVFKVDARTGKVLAMKIRKLE
jgi:hypothetical protein